MRPLAGSWENSPANSEAQRRSQDQRVAPIEVAGEIGEQLPALAGHEVHADLIHPLGMRMLIGFKGEPPAVFEIRMSARGGGRVPVADAQPGLQTLAAHLALPARAQAADLRG